MTFRKSRLMFSVPQFANCPLAPGPALLSFTIGVSIFPCAIWSVYHVTALRSVHLPGNRLHWFMWMASLFGASCRAARQDFHGFARGTCRAFPRPVPPPSRRNDPATDRQPPSLVSSAHACLRPAVP